MGIKLCNAHRSQVQIIMTLHEVQITFYLNAIFQCMLLVDPHSNSFTSKIAQFFKCTKVANFVVRFLEICKINSTGKYYLGIFM